LCRIYILHHIYFHILFSYFCAHLWSVK